MQPKLIVFDLNHTLIRDNSWRNLNLAMGITPEEDAALIARAAQGEITDAEGQAWLLQRYQQRGDCHREAVQRVLSQYTYMPHAQMVVAALQARGYRVAINSGAMDILVSMVAEQLGVVLWRESNHFIFDNHDMLCRIDAPDNDAAAKLQQLRELAAEQQVSLSDCLVVGDGSNDVPLFAATGNGVAFAGSPAARHARWGIADLRDVLTIVG
jgi:HAD phosphoserine phosphatase-like hydrolase, family IB